MIAPNDKAGGPVAIRGFLVQTLVALLDAVTVKPPFTEITLEPAIGDEQFDFVIKDSNGLRATQVKSTVSSFSKSDVTRWAAKMEAARRGESCRLLLVGLVPASLAHVTHIGAVALERKNLDLTGLLREAAQLLAVFLEAEGIHAGTGQQREMIVHALVSKLQHFATKSSPLSREEFVRLLREWVSSAPKDGKIIELSHFDVSKYAPAELIGREQETKLLSDAWSQAILGEKGRPRILTFVALGGEGKTSLVAKWAAELAHQDWPGCDAVFAWSFYSQGTREQQAASSDLFLKEALNFFATGTRKKVKDIRKFAASNAGAFEKGKRLAQLVGERRALLILDGLEPLQYAPTAPTPGQLKDQGITALLKGLAAASHGLCVVTTRYSLPDLKAFWQTTAPEVKLLRLSRDAGVHLLKTLGVRGTAQEVATLVEDVKGHALTLTLLGGFLKRAFHGDIRQRDRVKFEKADEKMDGGHAFRTMAAYEQWLLRDGGDEGRREVAVLRLMGLFDRPADAGCLAALRRETIPGLTEPIAGLADEDWEYCLSGLETAKLLTVNRDASGALVSLDAHPHLREYFARQLREQHPDAWREGNSRLYEYFRDFPDRVLGKPLPDTLTEMEPLFRAVLHGCAAGRYPECLHKIYIPRIQRGDKEFNVWQLYGLGSGLGAIASFFEPPWAKLACVLAPEDESYLLTEAARYLWFLCRFSEAVPLYEIASHLNARIGRWAKASEFSMYATHVSVSLGRIDAALGYAKSAIRSASRAERSDCLKDGLAAYAKALFARGDFRRAGICYRRAEILQSVLSPAHMVLCETDGSHYCDLLLQQGEYDEAQRRAETKLTYECEAPYINCGIMNHWIIGQCLLLSRRGNKAQNWSEEALRHLNLALQMTEETHDEEYPSLILLSRAALHREMRNFDAASRDLDEALDRASRCGMVLLQIDCHLEYARLASDPGTAAPLSSLDSTSIPSKPRMRLSALEHCRLAERMIEETKYFRRKQELHEIARAIHIH